MTANPSSKPTRGRFITAEGIDSAGKSTCLASVGEFLSERGVGFALTMEPGGTEFGLAMRRLVLDIIRPTDALAEALAMFAARREHIARVIEPALAAGRWVLCDRFTDSTYAYQGGGRGLGFAPIAELARICHPALKPDLTLLLDLPANAAFARKRKRAGNLQRAPAAAAASARQHSFADSAFDRESEDFFDNTRAAYLRLAKQEADRIALLDAKKPAGEVARAAIAVLQKRFKSELANPAAQRSG